MKNMMKLFVIFMSWIVATPTEVNAHEIPLPMIPFRKRTDLAGIVNDLDMERGVEVGVRRGEFALHNLNNWPLNKEYWLVDLWQHQDNYFDNANMKNKDHEKNYKTTMKSLKKYEKKIKICRNYSTICSTFMPNDYFDFVYIDARHDRKGCHEDLVAYWPKVKRGGCNLLCDLYFSLH